MENPDLVLQETGSRPTYSRLNYVPSGDTLRRDAISSLCLNLCFYHSEPTGCIQTHISCSLSKTTQLDHFLPSTVQKVRLSSVSSDWDEALG